MTELDDYADQLLVQATNMLSPAAAAAVRLGAPVHLEVVPPLTRRRLTRSSLHTGGQTLHRIVITVDGERAVLGQVVWSNKMWKVHQAAGRLGWGYSGAVLQD